MRLLADLPLGRKLLGGFSLVLLLLLGLSAAAYVTTEGNVQASASVEHTLQVIALAEATEGDMVDMETGYRGFLLTGQEQFLDPYSAGMASYPDRLTQLEQLTADNPPQVARWQNIDNLTQQWTQQITEPRIALRRQVAPGAQPSPELVSLVSAGEGRDQFTAIRQIFDEAISTEQGLLATRLNDAEAANQRLVTTLLIGTAAALVVGVLAALLLTRDITAAVGHLADAAAAVAGGDLKRRIRLHRRDEVGRAARAFDDMANQLEVTIGDLEMSSAELMRKQVELERSNRELQDFASVASHDLQEPLRKVRAFGDRLSAKSGADLTDQGRDYLARMQDAAARMQTLINDLLTFSRVTTRAQPLVPVDLNQVVAQVVSDLEVRIQQSDATLDIDALPTIDGDQVQLGQLFQNLLSNALKFQRPDVTPVVRIYAEDLDETNVQLFVQDNGIGFDEKYLDRIFTIFQRLHGRVEYEGTGVGLAVCRKIVERHGGTISARSAPGEGATFLVTLPRSHPEVLGIRSSLHPARARGSGVTVPPRPIVIVLADDDPDDCMLAQEALEESRLANELHVVGDGEELLAYLRHENGYAEPDKAPRPCLILLDLNMPRKDGREALREIKADPALRSIPIVVLTTSRAEEDIYRTYDLGVSSFISKPVTFEGLVDVMKVLGRYWFEIVELPGSPDEAK